MDADSSHYVGLRGPGAVSTNVVWTLPATDGSAGQLLKTDGSGNLGGPPTKQVAVAHLSDSLWLWDDSYRFYSSGADSSSSSAASSEVGSESAQVWVRESVPALVREWALEPGARNCPKKSDPKDQQR